MIGAKLARFTESELSVSFFQQGFLALPEMERHVVVPSLVRKVCLQPSNSDRPLGEDESKHRGDGLSRKNHSSLSLSLSEDGEEGPEANGTTLSYVESLKSAQRTSLR